MASHCGSPVALAHPAGRLRHPSAGSARSAADPGVKVKRSVTLSLPPKPRATSDRRVRDKPTRNRNTQSRRQSRSLRSLMARDRRSSFRDQRYMPATIQTGATIAITARLRCPITNTPSTKGLAAHARR